MNHSRSVAARTTAQKNDASGEFSDTSQSANSINDDDDDEVQQQQQQRRADRISVRNRRHGGDLRKYPTKRDLVRMRCVFIGPLDERYYEIAAPFRQYRANYMSGFDADVCRPYFVHQPRASRSRQERDQQFPDVGSVVELVRASNDDEMRRGVLEGLDVRPMRPSGLAVVRFLDARWRQRI
jgi:hypothetical protein